MRPARTTAHFALYARPNALPQARLGIVAAKRLAPRAVTRNAIKRAARECFRQMPLAPFDCIVRLTRAVNSKAEPARNTRLQALLHAELRQLFDLDTLRPEPRHPPKEEA